MSFYAPSAAVKYNLCPGAPREKNNYAAECLGKKLLMPRSAPGKFSFPKALQIVGTEEGGGLYLGKRSSAVDHGQWRMAMAEYD